MEIDNIRLLIEIKRRSCISVCRSPLAETVKGQKGSNNKANNTDRHSQSSSLSSCRLFAQLVACCSSWTPIDRSTTRASEQSTWADKPNLRNLVVARLPWAAGKTSSERTNGRMDGREGEGFVYNERVLSESAIKQQQVNAECCSLARLLACSGSGDD